MGKLVFFSTLLKRDGNPKCFPNNELLQVDVFKLLWSAFSNRPSFISWRPPLEASDKDFNKLKDRVPGVYIGNSSSVCYCNLPSSVLLGLSAFPSWFRFWRNLIATFSLPFRLKCFSAFTASILQLIFVSRKRANWRKVVTRVIIPRYHFQAKTTILWIVCDVYQPDLCFDFRRKDGKPFFVKSMLVNQIWRKDGG